MTFSKVNVIGQRCFHYFKDVVSGDIVRIPCTDQQYEALGLPGAGSPPSDNPNFEWIKSAREPKYNTQDGDLPEDGHAVLDSGQEVFRLLGQKNFEVNVVKPGFTIADVEQEVYGNRI